MNARALVRQSRRFRWFPFFGRRYPLAVSIPWSVYAVPPVLFDPHAWGVPKDAREGWSGLWTRGDECWSISRVYCDKRSWWEGFHRTGMGKNSTPLPQAMIDAYAASVEWWTSNVELAPKVPEESRMWDWYGAAQWHSKTVYGSIDVKTQRVELTFSCKDFEVARCAVDLVNFARAARREGHDVILLRRARLEVA